MQELGDKNKDKGVKIINDSIFLNESLEAYEARSPGRKVTFGPPPSLRSRTNEILHKQIDTTGDFI